MARPLVIGVAEGGIASLPAEIRDRLAGMDLVVAAPRFRDGLPDGPETIDWPSPFSDIFNVLSDNPDKSAALLTTGDPMWYGAGASLVRELGPDGGGSRGFRTAACGCPSRLADGWLPCGQHPWPAGIRPRIRAASADAASGDRPGWRQPDGGGKAAGCTWLWRGLHACAGASGQFG